MVQILARSADMPSFLILAALSSGMTWAALRGVLMQEDLEFELSHVNSDSHNINRSAASFDCSSSPQLCCCPMVVVTTPDGSWALSSMFNSKQRLVSATAHPQQYVRAPFNLAPHSALRHRRHRLTLVGIGGCLIHTPCQQQNRL